MASRWVRAAALLATFCGSARADYTFQDLGPASVGAQGQGNSINGSGMVAGTIYRAGLSGAFCYAPGAAGPLAVTTLGGSSSTANGVNDSGQVTGTSQYFGGGSLTHAYLSGPTGVRDLGTLSGSGSSTGYAVNDSGVVVGQSSANGGQHAFLADASGMHDLGVLGGTRSAAYSVNGSGHAVGISQVVVSGQLTTHGFYFDGTTMHDLGSSAGFLSSCAESINASNHVVGYELNAQGYAQAFLDTTPGTPNALETISGFPSVLQSFANGINGHDAVVGEAVMADGTDHAFLWTASGGMIDLNSLIPPGSDMILNDATGINDAGQITGYYTLHPGTFNAEVHAFVLGPAIAAVPVPPSMILLGLGLIGVAGRSAFRLTQGRTN